MNDISRDLDTFINNERVLAIILIKHILKTLITETNLKSKINTLYDFHQIIYKFIALAAIKTGITNRIILKKLRDLILKHSIRGYFFPETFEAITLEIIQILELTCISFHIE